ncbi:selenocysteine-specific translation elongation factor [Euzebya sp.]|uniref:selenocysteine-specific translation elongation factor n=1 Tax=Euzebya sp. TaxID=1971409 RepID=UPI0035178EBB
MTDHAGARDLPVRVVCTAGHVDHGKSTLVAALTGTDPDRLAEEKRRGLTIDLGFAWTEVGDVRVAFVDLPGHERFVPNMLAGAGPVQIALLVVAADEGWMPQSAEHLDILRLLDVRHGVVAVTRTDLVDDETAELAIELTRDELAGSGLADAPIVAVSAATGAGLDDLRRALSDVIVAAPAPADRGRPRLWIDRGFTIRGAGTVVTGTLTGGGLAVGDVLAIWPDGPEARVRGLQVLGADVAHAPPGCRVAVNLAGVDLDDVPRGAMLGRPSQWTATTTVDAWCRTVGDRPLSRRGAWKLHVGTAAVPVRPYPVGGEDLVGEGPVRLELAERLALAAGDRVVLRDAGSGGTGAGGQVIHPDPGPRPRGRARRDAAVARLTALAAATDPVTRLEALVAHDDEVAAERALALADAGPDDLAAADLVTAGAHVLAPTRWQVLADLAVGAVRGEHDRRPARSAVDRSVPRALLASAGADPAAVDGILDRLVATGRLESLPGGLRVPGHEARLTVAQQTARTDLLELLDGAGVAPPELTEAAARTRADQDLVDALVRAGQLVPLPGVGRALSRTALDGAVATLRRLQDQQGPFTASQAREAWGTSRKHALPLLELTDALGLTERDGDHRVVIDRG